MSDLDDGLVNILSGLPDPDGGISAGDMEYALDAIKQAFTDAGYIDKHLLDYPGELKKQLNYYSGQEWYNRFIAALDDDVKESNHLDGYSLATFTEAAKRAANINEQEHN